MRWVTEKSEFDSRQGQEIHLFTAPGLALGQPQPPIHWVVRNISEGVQRLRRETDHSPPYTERITEGKPAGFRGRKANLCVCG
jgi:hypothetical protein